MRCGHLFTFISHWTEPGGGATIPSMRDFLKKYLLWPWQLYVWFIYLPLVAIWTMIMATIVIFTAIFISKEKASKYPSAVWAKVCTWLTPALVRVKGREHLAEGQAYVVVSNHQSQYDILLLYGWIGLSVKWIMKKEIRKIPAIGIANEKIGNIFIDRSNPAAAQKTINNAIAELKDGVGILFFPEGTRSKDGNLLPFKKGAFRIAIEQQLPILPVTVRGTRGILPSGSFTPFPGRMSLRLHPPIPVAGLKLENKEDLPALMEESRRVIESGFGLD